MATHYSAVRLARQPGLQRPRIALLERLPIVAGFALSLLLLTSASGYADHIPKNKDVNSLRTKLDKKEGYLNFRTDGHGEEYTGHTDKDRRDWADNWITVRPVRLKDSGGIAPTNATDANIASDFEFMRKIYAQAGMSVRMLPIVEQQLDVTWANFTAAERRKAANAQNNTDGVVNLFYAKSFSGNTSNGLSIMPSQVDGVNIKSPYSFVRDGRDKNTSAHELGHQLLNSDALWREDATPSESSDITNLMFRTNAGSAQTLQQVGQKLSDKTGGHDIIEHRMDGAKQAQIGRIHENGGARNGVPDFVQHKNYHDTHGDRADFDWVSDQRLIETIPNGGHGADHNPGVDFLTWEINPAAVGTSTHIGPDKDAHDHDNLGTLELNPYNMPFFNAVDVVSNINLYADNDIDLGTGDPSDRSKALDYHTPDFSVDGVTWIPGQLDKVFQQGWNPNTTIDDWVARWVTGVKAKYVRISGVGAGIAGHDGNTQIDAVIAAQAVPEPPAFLLLSAGALSVTGFARRRRKQGV